MKRVSFAISMYSFKEIHPINGERFPLLCVNSVHSNKFCFVPAFESS